MLRIKEDPGRRGNKRKGRKADPEKRRERETEGERTLDAQERELQYCLKAI